MGAGIGVKPAIDNQYLPTQELQKIYTECYGLNYTPTIMVPASFNKQEGPIYYPLLCPFAKINTFKTNQSNSAITELEILKKVLLAYQEEFTEETGDAFGSMLYKVSKETVFSFYHYKATGSQNIYNSDEITNKDERFKFSFCPANTTFASDSKLFRGCVQLTKV